MPPIQQQKDQKNRKLARIPMCSKYNVNYRNDLPRWHKVPQHSRAAGAASDDYMPAIFASSKVKK